MMINYPSHIFSGVFPTPHCQGIALDRENGCLYFSFTTSLVKTDLQGHLIGTVDGLTGHLGCIAFANGHIFGSLEYKNDAIGRGIHAHLGLSEDITDAFYTAVFDCSKIDRVGMDAARDGVMHAAFLKEVLDDFHGVSADGLPHHYGCSGIDGMTLGPAFGKKDGETFLSVAYGIYRDDHRTDNDYQVILSYRPEDILAAAKPLNRHALHLSGPEKPAGKYFVFTGNTDWGVQNFEYDRFTGDWLMAVYPGFKPAYPNCPFYIIDGEKAPFYGKLRGLDEEGWQLTLKKGPVGNMNGVSGWRFPYGSTGLYAFGDGRYYISQEGKNDKGQFTDIYLYRFKSAEDAMYFERVDE